MDVGDEEEVWTHQDGGRLELYKFTNEKEYVTLEYSLEHLTPAQRTNMADIVAVSVPTWEDGKDWVVDNLPATESSDADWGTIKRKAFTSKYHGEVVGGHEEITVHLGRDLGLNDPPVDRRMEGVLTLWLRRSMLRTMLRLLSRLTLSRMRQSRVRSCRIGKD